MNKQNILIITLILLLSLGISAYSKEASIAKDTLLYVKDHAGENFLVLKVEECVLGDGGQVSCAMKPEEGAKVTQAGPVKSFWAKLAYPQS
ncbi:MAG TPA: hypothetical protein VI749_09220 [Candidatus Omnitrophota bacterium]|nr:hypothetical protein [Candidatus Omnitrophota bacterium]